MWSVLAGVIIGFEQIDYSVSEDDTAVNLRVGLLQGAVEGTSVVVSLSTRDGTATGQLITKPSCIHIYVCT